MLEFIVIGIVIDKASTGYEIKKYIEEGIGVFYKASHGSLYPALKKLTGKGHLSMLEEMQGGRLKKYYQATEKGKAAFFDWLSSPIDLVEDSEKNLAKVYFFDRLPEDIRDVQLQEYEIKNVNYLRRLKELEKHFNQMENKYCFYYKLSTLYYGICIISENIRWCRHLRQHKPLSQILEDK